MLRKIRLTFAMICFVLITLLFLDFTGILEESYNLFTHKRFGRMTGNWVTNWQPYLFLRFAVSCLT